MLDNVDFKWQPLAPDYEAPWLNGVTANICLSRNGNRRRRSSSSSRLNSNHNHSARCTVFPTAVSHVSLQLYLKGLLIKDPHGSRKTLVVLYAQWPHCECKVETATMDIDICNV